MYVIKIAAYDKWRAVYVIDKPTKLEAEKTAYAIAKSEFSCRLPRSYEDFKEGCTFWGDFRMEVLADNAKVARIKDRGG